MRLCLLTTGIFGVSALAFGQPSSKPKGVGDGGPAIEAELNAPSSVVVDKDGNLYVYEALGRAIRRIDSATGKIDTVAAECYSPGQKPPPTGCFGPVSHLQIAPDGRLLLSEYTFNRLSAFDLRTQRFSVIAGNGSLRSDGDGGLATQAGVPVPHGFTIDSRGNIIICDSGQYIRRVDSKTGIISTVAGSGKRGFAGDRGQALAADCDPAECGRGPRR